MSGQIEDPYGRSSIDIRGCFGITRPKALFDHSKLCIHTFIQCHEYLQLAQNGVVFICENGTGSLLISQPI